MNRTHFLSILILLFAFSGCKSDSPTETKESKASRLQITASPSTLVTGERFSLSVEARKDDGSLDKSFAESVVVFHSDGSTALKGTTMKNAVEGVAAFNDLWFSEVGVHRLTIQSGSLVQAVASNIQVSQAQTGAATKLAFADNPTMLISGVAFSLKVQALRSDNSLDTSFAQIITLSKTSGAANLQGALSQAAVNGEAVFSNLVADSIGSITIGAMSSALAAASQVFSVSPATLVLKQGSFSGQNNYTTSGSVQIVREANGKEFVKTGSNFRVQGGLGSISVWLARSNANVQVGNSSANVKVGTITTGFQGAYSFEIPNGLGDFTHVITFCDGARINFGFSQLQNP